VNGDHPMKELQHWEPDGDDGDLFDLNSGFCLELFLHIFPFKTH
jgi:hypothetical protein